MSEFTDLLSAYDQATESRDRDDKRIALMRWAGRLQSERDIALRALSDGTQDIARATNRLLKAIANLTKEPPHAE